MPTSHASVTGSDLHEPKGVAAATSGQVYLTDGSASGTHTNIATAVKDNPAGGTFILYVEVAVNQSALVSAAKRILIDSSNSETYKIREIFLSGNGTNFSGGGGDRLIAITDGTTIWSVIPAATAQTLAVARWGDTGTPFPATAAHLTANSVAGTDIYAQYSGGGTDYTAGELTLIIAFERTV